MIINLIYVNKLKMTTLKIINNFCDTLDTSYLIELDKLNKKYGKIFIYNAHIAIREKKNITLAKVVLKFYNEDIYTEEMNQILLENNTIYCNKLFEISGKTIINKHRSDTTLNGIKLDLLKSLIQKNNRRNNTLNAIWTGIEWGLFICGPVEKKTDQSHKQSTITNLRNRLKIGYIEDIGPANVDLWFKIDKIIDTIDLKTNPTGQNILKNLVTIISGMSQTYHTRICSYVNSIYKLYSNTTVFNKQVDYLKYFPNVSKLYQYLEKNEFQKDENDTEKIAIYKLNIHLKKNLEKSLMEGNIVCFTYAQMLHNFGKTKINILNIKYPKTKEGDKQKNNDMTKVSYTKNNEVIQILQKVYMKKGLDMKYVNLAIKWFISIKNLEAFLAFFMPMLLLCFDFKIDGKISQYIDYTHNWKQLTMLNIMESKIDIPDYVIDIHTSQGISRGFKKTNYKGIKLFIEEGAYVSKEYILPDKNGSTELYTELAAYYNFTKILTIEGGGYQKAKKYLINIEKYDEKDNEGDDEEDDEGEEEEDDEGDEEDDEGEGDNEDDYFNFIARAQITTSKSKNDSYMAIMKNNYKVFNKGDNVFVKGPYDGDNTYNILKLYINMKKILGLPYINVEKIDLKMANFSEFMGEKYVKNMETKYIRYNLDKNKKYTFLIYQNLCGDNIPIRKYGINAPTGKEKSADWIKVNATVVAWEKENTMNCKQFWYKEGDLNNQKYLISYALSIYFRSLFGIVDTTDRNFLIDKKNNIFYSVDEENLSMVKDCNFSKLGKHFQKIRESWGEIGTKIDEVIEIWVEKLPEIEKLLGEKLYKGYKNRFDIILKSKRNFFK
jgi:hypothetical protein